MKKSAIVALALIVVSAAVFGYSLFNYIDANRPEVASTIDEVEVLGKNADETQGEDGISQGNRKMPSNWNDNGIFAQNYERAYSKVVGMSQEELVGSVIMGVCDYDSDEALTAITKYKLGGFWMESECFSGKSESDIKAMVKKYKQRLDGFLVAVDEEGGRYTSVTDHDAYTDFSFDSVGNIYREGGLTAVENMENDKLSILKSAGISLNLAPVLDLAVEEGQVMYSRSLGAEAAEVSKYGEYVTKTFQEEGVSVCPKHFPGYGTLEDSYGETLTDDRLLKDFQENDFLPFKACIDAKCHFVMVSNVTVKSMDPSNIASLSSNVHKTLRDEFGFTGIIISDNLNDAYYYETPDYVKAVTAGNDMIISSNYGEAAEVLLEALQDGSLSEETLQKAATRVLAYKYTVGLLKDKKVG